MMTAPRLAIRFAIRFASGSRLKLLLTLAVGMGAIAISTAVANGAAPVSSLRVYLFDCGSIHGEDPVSYGLKPGVVSDPEMVVPCYLVVHPKGTLMWDTGVVPDSAFATHGPVSLKDEGDTIGSPRPLIPQLAAIGYPPSAITYLALSHYHSDHVANANAFAGSTWLVHEVERKAMFAASASDQANYSKLKGSKTVLLPATDYDVFGDGTVVIKPAFGHTPGHQVLALKLPVTGPVLIAGDLWHYAAERNAAQPPTGEADAQATLASRRIMEAYLKSSGAQLWIEHDPATFARLKKAPAFVQ